MKILLVIIMSLNGRDIEQSYAMPTIAACWDLARQRVEILTEQHPDASKIGAGCTVDRGSLI